MIHSKFSFWSILPVILSFLIVLLISVDIYHFFSNGVFLINLVKQKYSNDYGGWGTLFLLVILLVFIVKDEILKKLLYIKIEGEMIEFKTLLSIRTYKISKIQYLREISQISKLGYKTRLMKVGVEEETYLISQLYIKNYEQIKARLDELIVN